jgi:hypothetical protein
MTVLKLSNDDLSLIQNKANPCQLYYLYLSSIGGDPTEFKIAPAYLIKLIKEGYITSGNIITLKGKALLNEVGLINEVQVFNSMNSDEFNTSKAKTVKKYEIEINEHPDFKEFWELYPINDGRHGHLVSRVLRWNKNATRELFKEALEKGYNSKDIVKALRNEITYRDAITNSDSNAYKFMHSSVNYFKNENYVKFIDYDTNSTKIDRDEFGKDVD